MHTPATSFPVEPSILGVPPFRSAEVVDRCRECDETAVVACERCHSPVCAVHYIGEPAFCYGCEEEYLRSGPRPRKMLMVFVLLAIVFDLTAPFWLEYLIPEAMTAGFTYYGILAGVSVLLPLIGAFLDRNPVELRRRFARQSGPGRS